ncbi:(2Fe-2S) ferredoxin domain-containing protein [Pseudomonas sp. ZM23]|uniref:(2Fe-2S) ferredoxin domain-containing protein n=1 Tax=Pseudomonas triclosanedens TaxID=2961893 RepID=A0ABY7A434_9PSED|nr:(2Fe-2S) ferredoxin domain-containing protein [Pseudomonas triclosanedens]MCP8464455.1 (2Fe-2S) ferredoxin domain-containing protein [Pseudomonas triclosanedens]MCP8471589.1 (2Fe-2S) ferredoxin domain-containing protein [Pseudomonas triclosanedens]MCP8477599.1 (2Fe-2S) ferredoxin domain-containing protein [Pseudomonas triclosanedens]WAI51060.1 (2Fe-2S) ferredoxin domain-containing protein [Pseudomonas triclosanedens]
MTILLVGPLHGIQGERLHRDVASRLARPVERIDTSDGFDGLWARIRTLLGEPRELLLVDLEPTADGAYLDWLRAEVAALAQEHPQAPQVTTSALGRRGLDTAAVLAAIDDPAQQVACRGVGAVAAQPDWSAPPPHRHHLFLCTGPRCVRRGALPLWKTLRRELQRLGLYENAGGALLTRTGCQFPCNRGPILTVYPQRVWYGVHSDEQVCLIVHEHLRDGVPVAALRVEDDQ